MSDRIVVTGMVITSSPAGENDKRIVLLTKELGKISAFARGARRPGNHLMAASDSFAFGTFYLVRGREAYTLTGADISSYFRELTEDIVKTYTAYYFLELAEYYAVENQEAYKMLKLLYVAFRALSAGRIDSRLVRYVYELKILVINGEYPDFSRCAGCGGREELTEFSVFYNGMLCRKCAGNAGDAIHISPSALYALQYIVYADFPDLYKFTVTPEVLSELKMVTARCMHSYTDKKMNSADILDVLEQNI